MKNALLIHGFNGIPKIFEYFKEELEKKNYNVIMPNFPVREEITKQGYFEVLDMHKNIFNDDLIVIAHSIGNPMFLKYIANSELKVEMYISLAGFSSPFYNEGKDVLNEKVKLSKLTQNEVKYINNLDIIKYSIYSDSDHIVPIDILEMFSKDINSKGFLIKDIGHMGKKSGLEKLPEVLKIIKENS